MMRKPKYTDKLIETILSKYEDKSMTVTEICREYDISDTTFYKWRASSGIARKSQRLLKKKDAEIAHCMWKYNNLKPHQSLNNFPPRTYAQNNIGLIIYPKVVFKRLVIQKSILK